MAVEIPVYYCANFGRSRLSAIKYILALSGDTQNVTIFKCPESVDPENLIKIRLQIFELSWTCAQKDNNNNNKRTVTDIEENNSCSIAKVERHNNDVYNATVGS